MISTDRSRLGGVGAQRWLHTCICGSGALLKNPQLCPLQQSAAGPAAFRLLSILLRQHCMRRKSRARCMAPALEGWNLAGALTLPGSPHMDPPLPRPAPLLPHEQTRLLDPTTSAEALKAGDLP